MPYQSSPPHHCAWTRIPECCHDYGAGDAHCHTTQPVAWLCQFTMAQPLYATFTMTVPKGNRIEASLRGSTRCTLTACSCFLFCSQMHGSYPKSRWASSCAGCSDSCVLMAVNSSLSTATPQHTSNKPMYEIRDVTCRL